MPRTRKSAKQSVDIREPAGLIGSPAPKLSGTVHTLPIYEKGREPSNYIQTYTGLRFYPLNPRVEEVTLADRARALSMESRFTGHTKYLYVVAEHVVRAARLALNDKRFFQYRVARYPHTKNGPSETNKHRARITLHHDDSEAYLRDLARPIKRMPEAKAFQEAEAHLEEVCFAREGLYNVNADDYKEYDNAMLKCEAMSLLPGGARDDWKDEQWFKDVTLEVPPIGYPWHPRLAELEYLALHDELFIGAPTHYKRLSLWGNRALYWVGCVMKKIIGW